MAIYPLILGLELQIKAPWTQLDGLYLKLGSNRKCDLNFRFRIFIRTLTGSRILTGSDIKNQKNPILDIKKMYRQF